MVNIVLLTKDRPELTHQAIRSLIDNTPENSYNLTIIDDWSGRNEFYRGIVNTHVLTQENAIVVALYRSRGIVGLVRNIGADFAQRYWGRGDWLYFSDNDVCFHPGWLEKMTWALYAIPSLAIVGGCRHPFHQPNHSIETLMDGQIGVLDPPRELITVECADAVAGYSMLMSWETFDTYGGFDQHAKGVGQSEDFAVCQKVVKAGYKVGYVSPPVLTVTGLTNTLGEKVPGYEELKAMVPEGVVAE